MCAEEIDFEDTPVFDERFIESLPEEPEESVYKVCNQYLAQRERHASALGTEYHQSSLSVIKALNEVFDLELNVPDPEEIQEELMDGMIISFFKALKEKHENRIERERIDAQVTNTFNMVLERFGSKSLYEFSDDDLERIQKTINELRDMITSSDCFENKHKDRILRRLETLQREIHKKMSNVDKLWGFMIDFASTLGKCGEEAKPFFDILIEMKKIVWKAEIELKGLPEKTPFPLLTMDVVNEDEEGNNTQ